jgi:hypothetical protein
LAAALLRRIDPGGAEHLEKLVASEVTAARQRLAEQVERAVGGVLVQAQEAVPKGQAAENPRAGQVDQPGHIVGQHEVPRRTQDVEAQDVAGVEEPVDYGIGEAGDPQAEGPFAARVVLRLHRDRLANPLERPVETRPNQALGGEPAGREVDAQTYAFR